jgi:hypothetical protein
MTHVEGTAGVGVGCAPAYVSGDLSDLYLVEILVPTPSSLSIWIISIREVSVRIKECKTCRLHDLFLSWIYSRSGLNNVLEYTTTASFHVLFRSSSQSIWPYVTYAVSNSSELPANVPKSGPGTYCKWSRNCSTSTATLIKLKCENSMDVKGNSLQIINVTVVRICRKWVIEMTNTTYSLDMRRETSQRGS